MEKNHPVKPFERYADVIVVHCSFGDFCQPEIENRNHAEVQEHAPA